MVYTQKQIYDYLVANPLGVKVNIGDLEDLNGQDYIFLNYLYDELIGSDDKGVYRQRINIMVATHDFDDRMTLTNYIKDLLNVSVTYERIDEYEYYTATCECGVLMYHG